MAIRDSQDTFMMGYDSGYGQACKDWKEKIDTIKDEVEKICIPFIGDSRYADAVESVLTIIDEVVGKESEGE